VLLTSYPLISSTSGFYQRCYHGGAALPLAAALPSTSTQE